MKDIPMSVVFQNICQQVHGIEQAEIHAKTRAEAVQANAQTQVEAANKREAAAIACLKEAKAKIARRELVIERLYAKLAQQQKFFAAGHATFAPAEASAVRTLSPAAGGVLL